MNSSIPPQAWVPVDEQIGWYGKLPAAGDFLYRRMPRELQAWWDRWMQNGLGSFKRWPDAMTRHYAVAPVWNFATRTARSFASEPLQARLSLLSPSGKVASNRSA